MYKKTQILKHLACSSLLHNSRQTPVGRWDTSHCTAYMNPFLRIGSVPAHLSYISILWYVHQLCSEPLEWLPLKWLGEVVC